MDTDREAYSRYQVICAECEAWTEGGGVQGAGYFYDGITFWRREANGKQRVVPSWRAPGNGWRHDAGCACELCGARRTVPLRGVSAA
jgi:hypothetical protein